jgi:hypothetical protein
MPAIVIVRLVWEQAPYDPETDTQSRGPADEATQQGIFCEIADVADIPVLHGAPLS